MKLLIYIFFLKMLFSVYYCLSKHENEIKKSLINHFGIKHCIIVGDSTKVIKTVKNIKYLANKNIFAIFMADANFVNYFRLGEYWNVKTAVIIGTKAMINIFSVAEEIRISEEMYPDHLLSPFTWIIFDQPISLENYYIPYNCELFLITPINDTHYKIIETYNIGFTINTTRQISIFGYWSNGVLTVLPGTKEKRRFNMLGEEILFLVPFAEIDFEIDDIQGDCPILVYPDCSTIFILKNIAEMMNATPIFHSLNDQSMWTNEWKVVMIGILTTETPSSAPWLGPLYFIRGYFFIKDNIKEEYRISAYSAPFSKIVWKYILVSLLVSSFTSFIIGLIRKDSIISLLFLRAAFEPFDTFCNQCGYEILKNLPSRLVWLSIQISASILVPLYSGFIVSYLTIPTPKLPFTDLETFVQDGTYKASGFQNTHSHFALKNALESFGQEGLKLPLDETPTDYSEARDWIWKKEFNYALAWHFYQFAIGYNIRRIPKPIFTSAVGMAIRDYSPYVEIYRINFYIFNTNGIVHKMRDIIDEMITEPEDYSESVQESFISMNLKHILLLLYIIIIGQVIAFALLIIELFWKKLKIPPKNFQKPIIVNS